MPARRRWCRTTRSCRRISRRIPSGSRRPARVTFRQVFLGEADPGAALAALAGGADPAGVGQGIAAAADDGGGGREHRWTGPSATASSRRWRRSPPGAWQGPVASAFGDHLVQLVEAEPAVAAGVRGGPGRGRGGLAAGEGRGAARGRSTRRCASGTRWCCRRRSRDGGCCLARAAARRWRGRRRRTRCSRGFSTCRRSAAMPGGSIWKVPTAGAGRAADRGGAAGDLRAAAGGGAAVRRGGLRGGVGGALSRAGSRAARSGSRGWSGRRPTCWCATSWRRERRRASG